MNDSLRSAIGLVANGRSLSAEQTADAFGVIMRGEATPALIAGLLVGLRAKGETADEVAGAALAMRQAMVPVTPGAGPPVVDTCGTGGGTVSTFNVSTAAALVAAAAGVRVAKHGNRSYTSKCGSADVLEALGVDIGVGPDRAAEVLNRAGMVFLFAPTYHPAMRHVGPTRKELGFATIMNLLGPLANPAGVTRQVIGVSDPARAPLMAEALLRLGAVHALVVHGEIGMDEISPVGRTAVWEVKGGEVKTWTLNPVEYGMAAEQVEDLRGGEPVENAARVVEILGGSAAELGGPATRRLGGSAVEERMESGIRAVILNAGAALYVGGVVAEIGEAFLLAEATLSQGAGMGVLDRMVGDSKS